ncbi:MAG: hypothetical protein WC365_03110 [Candidatus Babeliales bacterium]|jgi:cell division protein FtsL
MLHKHLHLSHLIVLCCIALAFIKIYQHNLIIGLNYELQRLEKQRSQLAKQRNDLLASLTQLHAPEVVMRQAQTHLGMTPQTVQHVIYLTPQTTTIDFIGTASTNTILTTLHLDSVTSQTGEKHACA